MDRNEEMHRSTRARMTSRRGEEYPDTIRATGEAAIVVLTMVLVAGRGASAEETPIEPPARAEPVDFARDILPVFRKNCLACHNASEADGDVILESPASIEKRGEEDDPIVAPGNAEESILFRVAAQLDKPYMPPRKNKVGAEPLGPKELELLKLWIDQGAKGEVNEGSARVEWFDVPSSIRAIYSARLSPDATLVAAARGRTVELFATRSGAPVGRLLDPAFDSPATQLDQVQDVAFSPDGRRIATSGFRSVKIWRRDDSAATPFGDRRLRGLVGGGADRVVAATAAGDIVVWNGEGDPKTIGRFEGELRSLRSSADGSRVLVVAEASATVLTLGDESAATTVAVTGNATCGVPSNDGSVLVVGTADGKLLRWSIARDGDAVTTTPLEPLEAHSGRVNAIAADPSAGADVVSVGADGHAKHWKLSEGKSTRTVNLGESSDCVAAAPDGERFAAGSASGALRIWDASGKILAVAPQDPSAQHRLGIAERSSQLAKNILDAATKAVAAADKEVKGADEAVAKAKKTIEDATKKLTEKQAEAAQTEDKKKAEEAKKALGGLEAAKKKGENELEDGELRRRRAGTARAEAGKKLELAQARAKSAEEAQKQRASEHQMSAAAVRSLAFTADGAGVIVGRANGRGAVYDRATGAAEEAWTIAGEGVAAVAATKDRVHSLDTSGAARATAVHPGYVLERRLEENDGVEFVSRITALEFSPDGSLLAVGGGEPSRSGRLQLFDLETGTLRWTIDDAHSDTVVDLEFTFDGDRIATAGTDKFARVFSAEDGSSLRSLEGHSGHVLGVSWSADGETVVSAGADNAVKVWTFATGEARRTIGGFGKQVTGVRFVGIGTDIVTSSGDRNVRRHRTNDGGQVRTYPAFTDFVHTVDLSADGRYVLAAGEEGTIRIYETDSGKLVREFGASPPKT